MTKMAAVPCSMVKKGSFQNTLTLKAPNTTIAEFANTADPDETVHNEPSHLDLQCLPSSILIFNMVKSDPKVFF